MIIEIAAVVALAAAPEASRAQETPGQARLFLAPEQGRILAVFAKDGDRKRPLSVTVVEPSTTCAIPLLEMPIDKRAIPLRRVGPLKKPVPMPQFRPRVCPKR